MSADPDPVLNVSLEDHLVLILRPLLALLPDTLAQQLTLVLDAPAALDLPAPQPRTIPYALLTAIARWARTSAAQDAFARHEPPLRAQDYSMVALLAGTRTSPERVFPPVDPALALQNDPLEVRRRELSDRRAVTALLNALLSIAGAGVATWWAADRLGWRNEWRVLLALSVAIVVASSEAALYLIWEDRRAKPTSTSTSARASRHRPRHAAPELVSSDKKREPASPDATHPDVQRTAVVSASSARVRGTADNALRERAGPSAEDRTARDH